MVLLPGYGKHKTGDDNFGVDWVIHYQFENLGRELVAFTLPVPLKRSANGSVTYAKLNR